MTRTQVSNLHPGDFVLIEYKESTVYKNNSGCFIKINHPQIKDVVLKGLVIKTDSNYFFLLVSESNKDYIKKNSVIKLEYFLLKEAGYKSWFVL